uniref:Uncharacterized protein n=2 Tax=Clastoptera arizonana TaxID=38151 RepID=A0A1B6DKS9_9HEMI
MNRSRGRNRQGYRTVVQRTGSIDKRTDNAADDNNHQRSNSGARFNNDGGFYKPFQPFQNDNYSNTSQNNFQTHQPGQYGQRSYSKPTNGMSGTSQFHNRQNFQPQNNEIPSILDLKVGAPVQPYRRVMQENGSTRGRGNGSQRFNRRGRNNYHGSRSPNDLRPSQLQLSNSGRQDLINKEAPRRPVRTSTENILGHGEEPGNINKARDLMEEEYKIQAAECAAKCREAELKKLQEKMMKLRFVSNFDTGYRFPVGPTVDNPKEREFRIQKLQESYNEQSREYQKELQKIEERKKALEEERRIERINSKDYDHIMLGVRLGSNPQTFFPENRGAIPKQGRHITSHKNQNQRNNTTFRGQPQHTSDSETSESECMSKVMEDLNIPTIPINKSVVKLRKPVQSSKPVKDKNKKIKFSSIQGDLSIIQSIYAEPEPEPEVSSTKDISIQEVREQMQEQYNKKVVQDLVKEYDKESFVPNSEDNELRIARLKMQKAYDHRAVQEKSEKVKEKSTDEVKPINSGQGVDKVKENSQTDNKLKPSEGNKNKITKRNNRSSYKFSKNKNYVGFPSNLNQSFTKKETNMKVETSNQNIIIYTAPSHSNHKVESAMNSNSMTLYASDKNKLKTLDNFHINITIVTPSSSDIHENNSNSLPISFSQNKTETTAGHEYKNEVKSRHNYRKKSSSPLHLQNESNISNVSPKIGATIHLPVQNNAATTNYRRNWFKKPSTRQFIKHKSNAPHNMSKTPQTGASLPSPSHNINKTASNSSNKSTEVIQSPPQSSAGSTNNKSCPLDVNSASQSFKIAPQKADAQLKINEVPQTLVGLPSPIQNMNKTVSTSSNAQVLHSLPQNGAGTTNDRSKTMDISAASQNEIRPQKPYAAQHNTKKGLHTEGLPPSNQNMNKRANTNSIQAAQSFLQNGAGDTNNRSNTITAISQTTSISAVSQNEVEPKKPNKNLVKRNVNKVPQNWEGLPSPNKNINNSTSFTTNNQAIQSPSNNTVTTNQESDLPNATQNKVAPKKSSAQQRIMEVLKNSVGLPLPNENMLKTGSISSNKETESPPPQNSVMTANNRNNTTVNTASQNKVGTQKNQNAESLDKAIDVLTSMENLEKYRKNLHSKRLDCIKSEMDELFSFIEKEKSSSQPIKEGKEAKELSYQEQLRQRALVMDKKYGAENAPKPSSTNVLPLHSEAPKQCSPATRSLRSVAQQPSSAARNINEQSLIRLLNLRELNHYDRTGLVPMKGGYYVDVKHCFTTNGVDKLGQPILQLRVK